MVFCNGTIKNECPTDTIIHKLTELFAKASAIRYFYRTLKVQLTDDSWTLSAKTAIDNCDYLMCSALYDNEIIVQPMSKIKNVNLEFSCPENFESMESTPLGFNCSKCSKELIDFREKSDKEIQQITSISTNPICGVFKRTQMSQGFLKYAAATFIASATALNLNAQIKELDSLELELAIDSLTETEFEDNDIPFLGIIIEVQAEPIGGYPKFFEAISKAIKHPPELNEKGKVFVQFTVDTLGKMNEFKIVIGYNKLAEEVTIEALKNLNFPFKPGKQRGIPVKTRLIIPVAFDPAKQE